MKISRIIYMISLRSFSLSLPLRQQMILIFRRAALRGKRKKSERLRCDVAWANLGMAKRRERKKIELKVNDFRSLTPVDSLPGLAIVATKR